jgi:hypothetical protein
MNDPDLIAEAKDWSASSFIGKWRAWPKKSWSSPPEVIALMKEVTETPM